MERLFYVYMLRCRDGKFYIGVTNDVERRVWQHNTGTNPDCFTFERRPVRLVWSSYFYNASDAIDWEKKIKRWTRRKKLALINGDWSLISKMARGKNRCEREASFDFGASRLRLR